MPEPSPRILIVNPYGIGDVLFSTPLLSALHERYPDAFIGYLIGSRTKAVLEASPSVNEIFVYDKDKLRSLKFWGKVRYFWSLVKGLRQKKFDILIDLSMTSEYAAIALFFLRIKKRIGFDYKGRGCFLNIKERISDLNKGPVARTYLELGRHAGIDLNADNDSDELKFYLSKESLASAEEKLESWGLAADQKLVMVIPGGGASWGKDAWYKQWPPEYFARVADQLTRDYGAKILIAGDRIDRPVLDAVAGHMQEKAIICTGMDLAPYAALMSFCRIVVCNDGGPLHVAVSQGTSTVSFFGPVSEKVYGPYTRETEHRVFTNEIECRPCYKNFRFPSCPHEKACLVGLGPERVLHEAKAFFDEKLKD